ncbi:MAG: hypothetical protein ACM3PY_14980 [Omnitrophica WOR_2 bacterium]
MSKNTMGIILIVLAVVIIVVSLGAGYIGLSASQAIGTRKIIGAVFGLVVGIAGVGLMAWKRA